MSAGIGSLKSCPEIQANLNGYFTKCDKTKLLQYHESSFVQFLRSPENTNGVLQQQSSPGRGKKRTVDLVYTPRLATSEFSDTPTKTCSSTNSPENCSEQYSIDNVGLQYDEKYDLDDLALICQDNPDFISERLLRMMNAAVRKMDADLVEDLTLLIGAFGSGEESVTSDVKTVHTRKSGGDPDPFFYEEVQFAAQNAGYCSVPYAFGYHEAYLAFRRAMAGCCANSGLNLAEMREEYPVVFSANSNVHTHFGSNNFVTIDAGAVQLLTYNQFQGARGVNELQDDSYRQGVIVHPETGIPFDFQWTNDCGDIIISIMLAYKLVGMPDDMFPSGDHHEGVVGVNQFLISNP